MITNILDFLLNRLPFISFLNGNKTKIAGALIALSALIIQVAPLIPEQYRFSALAISELLKQIAEVLGSVGVAGIIVKKWKMPEAPEMPEVIKKDA